MRTRTDPGATEREHLEGLREVPALEVTFEQLAGKMTATGAGRVKRTTLALPVFLLNFDPGNGKSWTQVFDEQGATPAMLDQVDGSEPVLVNDDGLVLRGWTVVEKLVRSGAETIRIEFL